MDVFAFDIKEFCYGDGEAIDGSIVASLLNLTYADDSRLEVFFSPGVLAEFVEGLLDAIERSVDFGASGGPERWPLQALHDPRRTKHPSEVVLASRASGVSFEPLSGSIMIAFMHPDGSQSYAHVTIEAAQLLVHHGRMRLAFPIEDELGREA